MSDAFSPPPAPAAEGISAEERQWGMFVHLATLVGLIIPLGSVLGPLVIWLIKKDTMAFVDDQGKEAVNFQITVAIVGFVGFILSFILIGIPLLIALGIAWLVLSIMAGIKANEGQYYRYPFAIRLIK